MTKEETIKKTQEDLKKLGIQDKDLEIITQDYAFTNQWLRNDAYKVGLVFCENGSKINYVLLYYSTTNKAWVILGDNGKLKTKEAEWLRGYRGACVNFIEAKKIISKGLPKYLETKNIKSQNLQGSFGEQIVQIALKELNLYKSFTIRKEYPLPDLIGCQNLWKAAPRFDFAVLDKETNEPLMFIEFDGQQHHQKNSIFSNDFTQTVLRDKAKESYAFYTMKPLIRIPSGILDLEHHGLDTIKQIILTYIKVGNEIINKQL